MHRLYRPDAVRASKLLRILARSASSRSGMLDSLHNRRRRTRRYSSTISPPRKRLRKWLRGYSFFPKAKEVRCVLAIAGTGYGLIGLLFVILLIVLIFYFVRRA